MQLMSVVLPEPFGPMRPKRSPALTCSVTPLSAVNPPKRLTMPCTSSSAPAMASPASQAPHEAQKTLGRQDDEGHQHDATMKRFISEEIVTVASCWAEPSRTAPI